MARMTPGASSRRPTAGYDPSAVVPKRQIPHPGKGKAWDRRTRQAWQALVSEPWTADWSASDLALATRWCHLQQVFWEAIDRNESPSALKSLNAELRAMEASLFASPRARVEARMTPSKGPRGVRQVSTVSAVDLLAQVDVS